MNTRAVITGCRQRTAHLLLRSQIDAFVDGELTGARRASVAAHVAACWACSGYTDTVRMIKRSLRRARGEEPVSPFNASSRNAPPLSAAPSDADASSH